MADPIIARDLTPGQQSLLYASLITVLAQDHRAGARAAPARSVSRDAAARGTARDAPGRTIRHPAGIDRAYGTDVSAAEPRAAPATAGPTFDKLTLVERHLIAETAVVVWETLMDVLAVRTPDIEAWEADCLMFEGAYDPAALLRRKTDGVQ